MVRDESAPKEEVTKESLDIENIKEKEEEDEA